MTIKQYLDKKPAMTCAEWCETIAADGLKKYESQIIAAADALNLVKINKKADFIKAINK